MKLQINNYEFLELINFCEDYYAKNNQYTLHIEIKNNSQIKFQDLINDLVANKNISILVLDETNKNIFESNNYNILISASNIIRDNIIHLVISNVNNYPDPLIDALYCQK